ncbi:MAG TPA: hypothetical protein VHY08_24230 [Bacillota bacterium]|nr:hypothetical protein [Bacillota bacterium]
MAGNHPTAGVPCSRWAKKNSPVPGIHDMSGNVWDWCFDNNGSNRVVRGCSFYNPGNYMLLGYFTSSPPTTAKAKSI